MARHFTQHKKSRSYKVSDQTHNSDHFKPIDCEIGELMHVVWLTDKLGQINWTQWLATPSEPKEGGKTRENVGRQYVDNICHHNRKNNSVTIFIGNGKEI